MKSDTYKLLKERKKEYETIYRYGDAYLNVGLSPDILRELSKSFESFLANYDEYQKFMTSIKNK